MKKNLRIASAAAAALLAVAPVAASAVSVNAADTASNSAANNKSTNATADTHVSKPDVKLTNVTTMPLSVTALDYTDLSQNDLTAITDQLKSKKLLGEHEYVSAESFEGHHVSVYNVSSVQADGTYVQTLSVPVYAPYANADGKGTHAGFVKNVYVQRTVKNVNEQGTPYFFNRIAKGQPVVAGTVYLDSSLNVSNGFTAQQLLDTVEKNYGARVGDSSYTTVDITTTASDVASQLQAQGVKRTANGGFDFPSSAFTVKLTAQAQNGNKEYLTVIVNNVFNPNYPSFTFGTNSRRLFNGATAPSTVKVALNGDVKKAVTDQVKAYVSSTSNNQLTNLTVDTSAVKANTVGLYSVVVSATNPANETSKLNVLVQVGDPSAVVATVASTTGSAPVVNINGNVVSTTTETLANGQTVETFGKVVINGVSYTKIKTANGTAYVETKYLDGSQAQPAEVTTTKTIWHVAKIYDKDGKATSEASLHAYNTVSVVSTPVTINGAKYYKLAGKDQYVKAGNIDGTSRTLSHNAYVYKNTGKAKTTKSGKKTKKVVLKKGSQVTTYGSAFTVNGHKMFRIGRNQYVKVANF